MKQHALRGMNEGSTPQVADVRAHRTGGMYNSAWERVLEHVAQVFGLGQEGFFLNQPWTRLMNHGGRSTIVHIME